MDTTAAGVVLDTRSTRTEPLVKVTITLVHLTPLPPPPPPSPHSPATKWSVSWCRGAVTIKLQLSSSRPFPTPRSSYGILLVPMVQQTNVIYNKYPQLKPEPNPWPVHLCQGTQIGANTRLIPLIFVAPSSHAL